MPRAPKKNSGDQKLIQIVDAAFADAARRSGPWLVCHAGCTSCCIGAFTINQLDAHRLRAGLAELDASDPARAERVRQRARESVARTAHEFPGNVQTGLLDETEEADERFLDFANDEQCPALDAGTGLCDLYSARPMTCRVFGPPIRSGPENALGVCELCYHGASPEEIAACEMEVDPDHLEDRLLAELEKTPGPRSKTTVAFCLAK